MTGGAGFIGSAAVRRLVADGRYRVVVVDSLTYAGNLESLRPVAAEPLFVFRRHDIADAGAMRAVLAEFQPRAVLHLAAESHVDRSIDGPAAFLHTNLAGTFTLLQECLGFWKGLGEASARSFRFLHVSTDEVFGSLDAADPPFNEQTPYRPNSPYAATKAGADHLVRAWHATYGLPCLLTNCSNNYGPYQFPEKLIPLMIQRALSGRTLPVYGRGENVRDWLYVDDHVDALLAVLERGRIGDTYCVGGGAEHTNLDVVRQVCALLDELHPVAEPHAASIAFVDDRPGHDYRYAIDASKIREELQWRPRHGFDSGLRATVEWYLANKQWSEHVLNGSYRGERLGLAGAR